MNRITKKTLQARIDTINTILGLPSTPYTLQEDGTRTVNQGVFILTMAYGGYGVGKMSDEGGVWSAIWNGHISARDAYERTSAFIAGLTFNSSK
jgi:hypothetical protein